MMLQMKLREITSALERHAPLHFQEDYDNSGLQVGFPDAEISRVLVCLDVTEDVIDEAAASGCQLVLSHHPLLFKALRTVSDATYQQRCVVKALSKGIAIYSAHTNLDNARGGVNYMIASRIGLNDLQWLVPSSDPDCGSGILGNLPVPMDPVSFIASLSTEFGVECIRHSQLTGCPVSKVALCGGAGAFLMKEALKAGADCFISGEFHYHDYFENGGMLLAELGHFQSERFTIELLKDILSAECPTLEVITTEIITNPIIYTYNGR